MSIVNPLPPIQPAAPVSAITLSPEGREQNLRPEQVIQATVAEGGQDRVLLDMGHRRIWAETRLSLQKGQKLDLMVVETSPRIELRLMEMPLTERIGHALHLLGGKWDLLPLLRQLTEGEGKKPPLSEGLSRASRQALELFRSLLADLDRPLEGVQLRQLLKQMGVRLEANLAEGEVERAAETLKSALLEVAQKLKGGGGELASRVETQLQSLELFQLCSLRLAQQGAILWPLPLPFIENGYLMIEERREGSDAEEEPPWQLSLHLSLQAVGDLRVDFLYEAQGLFLRFLCDSEEKAEFFERFGDELRQGIGSVELLGLNFAGGSEAAGRALIERVLGEGRGVIDTRV